MNPFDTTGDTEISVVWNRYRIELIKIAGFLLYFYDLEENMSRVMIKSYVIGRIDLSQQFLVLIFIIFVGKEFLKLSKSFKNIFQQQSSQIEFIVYSPSRFFK